MKNISTILFIFLFTYCAHNTTITKKESLSYLDSIAPYMEDFAKDTATIYDWKLANDESIIAIVGKFIDRNEIYALNIVEKDTLINFYHYNNKKWRLIGTDKIQQEITFRIEFDDMNGDEHNEIILFSPPNMNGNTWQDVFYCSQKTGLIHHAGSFSTDFEINKDNKTVNVSYEGSWYMPLIKTLYRWQNEKLIRVKEINIDLVNRNMTNNERIFRYYENPTITQDTLVLKIEAPYKEEKYVKLWENFFDNN